MIVDLLLPCIPFEIVVYPSDPSRLTDLEAAALYFVGYHSNIRNTRAEDLSAFIGLGDAVFNDMLIRMVNRGWIKIHRGTRGLYLSNKALESLVRAEATPDEDGSVAMRAGEEGKRVWVCYDVIGGGYAVINRRFLFRAREDPFAVPPSNFGDDHETAPFGLAIDGYAAAWSDSRENVTAPGASTAESRRNDVMRALQADRWSWRSLFGPRSGTVPHIQIRPPHRTSTIDDLYYYRCRFNVSMGKLGEEADLGVHSPISKHVSVQEVEPPPDLICVEQRNPAVRRLGENLGEKIVHHAVVAASRKEGDPRFLKLLQRHAEGVAAVRRITSDPLTTLRSRIAELGKGAGGDNEDRELDDIRDLWAAAQERIETLVSSNLNLETSLPVPTDTFDETVAALLKDARSKVLVSSPQLRLRSQQLMARAAGLTGLADLATSGQVDVLVHGVSGTTMQGRELSHSQAIARVTTALGSSKVYVVDRSLDHLRTPFVQIDDDTLLWQSDSLFGEQSVHGLLLRLRQGGEVGSIARLERSLPPGLRERLLENRREERDALPVAWPADVVATIRDISDALVDARIADLASPQQRSAFAADVGAQLDFMIEWLKSESDSVEPIVGARINERCFELISAANDREPLMIGLAGRSDMRAFADLVEVISLRLQRQDATGLIDVATIVCLPDEEIYSPQAAAFFQYFPPGGSRVRLLRESSQPEGGHRTGFVATSTSVIMAHDGLINYVATAGRHIKGTHIGLHMMGRKARALAERFLVLDWPAASEPLAAGAAKWARPTREPSAGRVASLEGIAQRQEWFADGNRGATSALAWISAGDGDLTTWAQAQLSEARSFLAAPEADTRALGYAMTKALAILEGDGRIRPIGALALFATFAEQEDNFIVASILADSLAETSPYRDPLTRELAFALARDQAPNLTGIEPAGLETLSPTAACLACLLMMDAHGGELADWLAYLPATADEAAEMTLARVLASSVQETGSRIIDLGHLTDERDTQDFTLTMTRFREQVMAARTRQDTRLVPQVEALRDLVFVDKGSFVVDLLDAIELMPKAAGEDEQKQRILKVLKKAQDQLGVDLLAAGQVMGTSLDAKTLAKSFFDQKNFEMQRMTRHQAVDVEKGGRNILTTLKKILDLLLHDLVPQLSGVTTPAQRELVDVARRMMREPMIPVEGTLGRMQLLVRDRLRSIRAGARLGRPAWLFPTLPSGTTQGWAGRRSAIFTYEFEVGTKFHQVVKWFVEMDRKGEDSVLLDQSENPTVPKDALSLLHDFLQGLAGTVDDRDLENARPMLDARLREISLNASERIIGPALTLADQLSASAGNLRSAIAAAEDSRRAVVEHLQGGDIVAAVIQAGDLRANELPSLRREWVSVSNAEEKALLAELSGQRFDGRDAVAATVGARLRPPTSAEDIVLARTAVRLAAALSEPIQFNEALRLDVGEGLRPSPGLGSATGLLAVLAAARRSEDLSTLEELAGPENVANAVGGYFSELPASQLMALARRDGDTWRIRCGHPALSSLSFGASDMLEFILPLSRDTELDLRIARKTASAQRALLVAGRQAVARSSSRPASREPHQILLSLFISEIQPGLPVLLWRRLAQAASLPVASRRIATLSALAEQKFEGTSDLFAWWENLGAGRGSTVSDLLDLSEIEMAEGFLEVDFTRHIRNLCLGLGLRTSSSPAKLSLQAEGILAASSVWPTSQDSSVRTRSFGLNDIAETFGKMLSEASREGERAFWRR